MTPDTPEPFKPETWPVDADGFAPNLCTVCGTPTRYGSRHTKCAPGWKAPEIAQPATPEPPADAVSRFHAWAKPFLWSGDKAAMDLAFLAWNAATQPATHVALTDEQIEKGRHETFSTDNPFCPCDSKTMRKAVRWAERAHGIRAALATQAAFSSSNTSNTLGDAAARPGLSAGAPIPIAAGGGLSDSTSTEN